MADTADRFLTVLEHIQQTNSALVESLQQLLTRQDAALRQQEAEHQAFLGALQHLDASLQASTRETHEQGRTLGEMLLQLGETLSRTERMTAGILSRLDTSPAQ